MPSRRVLATAGSLTLATFLAVVAVVLVGAVQKSPCAADERASTSYAAKLCYNDISVLYAERGLDRPFGWFGGEHGPTPPIEYPPLTVITMEASARVTHRLGGAHEDATFYWVNAAWLAAAGIAALALLLRLLDWEQARRFAWVGVPLVVATGFINWDLLPLLLVVGALTTWRAGKPGWTGVLLGLGTAAKLYPALLLVPIVALSVRERRAAPAVRACLGALLAWLAADLPQLLLHRRSWLHFWEFNSSRPPDFGSPWYALRLLHVHVPTPTVNVVFAGCLAVACLGVLVLALRATEPPDVAPLALLLVTAFVVLNKVNSPQYVLWTLPLVALTCRSGRVLALWCVAELIYFVVVWQWLVNGAPWVEPTYVVLLLARLAAETLVAVHVLGQALPNLRSRRA